MFLNAIIDKNTGIILNVIEADQNYIDQIEEIGVDPKLNNGIAKVKKEDVIIVQHEVASAGDVVIGKKIYRYVSDL